MRVGDVDTSEILLRDYGDDFDRKTFTHDDQIFLAKLRKLRAEVSANWVNKNYSSSDKYNQALWDAMIDAIDWWQP